MKTVMKKMFSLLLVAVMLVSAVPTAFAATYPVGTADSLTCPGGADHELQYEANRSAATCTANAVNVYTCKTEGCNYAGGFLGEVDGTALGHNFNSNGLCQADGCGYQCPHANTAKYNGGKNQAATCTTAGYECHKCNDCGAFISVGTEIDPDNHSYDQGVITTEPTCTAAGVKTFTCQCGDSYTEPVAARNHDVVNGQCTRCTYSEICPTCKRSLTADHKCQTVLCTTCKDPYTEGTDHTCAVLTCNSCKETYTKGTSHVSGCPYCSECLKKGDKNTSHTASAHCSVCGVANGHATNCTNINYPATGNAKLYVWANLIVGGSEKETILLDTIEGLSGNDLIYQVVSRNENRLRSKIPNGYGWTGHVYYEQDSKTTLTVASTMTVADDDDVVINLYTDEKLVVARIHTGKSYTVDRLINIGGFQIGDTVTYNDVVKAAKKYYNVSSLKMYTPSDWEKIVTGGSADNLPNFKVHSGDNIVDVYLSGSRISSSGTTYTADSSNPKTGDMIFAPAAVLGLSVSALAVLFFLNKKRAY